MEGYWLVSRILPAYDCNATSWAKVLEYAEAMRQNDYLTGHHGFPPIQGFEDTVNEDDLGMSFNPSCPDYNEIIITEKHLGLPIFRVTEGNHRFLAAVQAGIYQLETEPDNSGFVSA